MILGPAQVYPVPDTSSSESIWVGAGILHGWGFYNASSTDRAVVTLNDGAGGPIIVPVSLKAGQSARDWLSGAGVQIVTGLYLTVVSGACSASLWFRPDDSGRSAVPLDVHDALSRLEDAAFGG